MFVMTVVATANACAIDDAGAPDELDEVDQELVSTGGTIGGGGLPIKRDCWHEFDVCMRNAHRSYELCMTDPEDTAAHCNERSRIRQGYCNTNYLACQRSKE